jgi:hypothetical protein
VTLRTVALVAALGVPGMAGWAADSGGASGGPTGPATSRFDAVRAPLAGAAAAVHALPDTVLRRDLDLPARSVRLGLGATAA